MIPHHHIAVQEQSQVGEARRAAVKLAALLGFDEVAVGKAALIVTELGNNLVRHAKGGRILLGADHERRALDMLALDDGPGMADVGGCLRDGYTTGGTPGTGFGAVQRLADEFSVFSMAGKGTVILARLTTSATAPGPYAYAGINIAAPGESISGDGWALRVDADKAAVMMADGLGHGPLAAEASDAALRSFAVHEGPPSRRLERAHEALRSTRGAAVAVAEFDGRAGTVLFGGIGNICGRLLNGIEDRSLMSQHGTIGLQIRKPQDLAYTWPDHGLLILHSDGIATRWSLAETPGLLQCDPAVIAGWLLREHSRGRDDATVVVIRRSVPR